MLIGRIIRLAFVILLAVGLGAGVTLSATPNPSDCRQCEDCATPCVALIMCGAVCVSPGLASTVLGVALHASHGRLVPKPGCPLSSAEFRTPTPPPKLSHFV